MLGVLFMFGLFVIATAGGVAIARAGNNAVHANTSTVGVLACLLAVSLATLIVSMSGAINGL